MRPFLAILAALPLAAAPLDPDPLVESAMREWGVPGMALAVVQQGSIVHVKGYGLRDAEKQLPVTPKTLFGIGSITKSFTVLALQSLAEEGRLDWDKPVRDYLADFRLRDPVATERATPLDLVTHRTGLPRHDRLWSGGAFSRTDLYSRLRFLKPSRDFRTTYQYNNLMFMTAGILAGSVAGQPWEDIVRKRIFEPAGMASTVPTYADAAGRTEVAMAYAGPRTNSRPRPIQQTGPAVDAIGPAGSIQSNIEDMARYLLLHIHRGEVNGKRVAAASRVEQMQQPRIPIPDSHSAYGDGQSYGMGLFVGSHRGRKAVWHTGTWGGYHALVWWLPAEKFGVAMLLNRSERAVPPVVALTLADRYLDVPAVDRLAERKEAEAEAARRARTAAMRLRKRRRANTRPSRPVAEFHGPYSHPAYGQALVSQAGEDLAIRVAGSEARYSHWHYDVFAAGDPDGEEAAPRRVRFIANADGEIDSLALAVEPAVGETVFRRTTP
jgi:CubicO group peptidase (beta-lactamase class C family)